MEKFPGSKYTAVGAFIFLRFFCPAIVAPEVDGLVSTPPTKDMRRGLMLIAKVIQNLANNVLFGAKEPYMFPLIDFLTNNIYKVTTFLREISVSLYEVGCGLREVLKLMNHAGTSTGVGEPGRRQGRVVRFWFVRRVAQVPVRALGPRPSTIGVQGAKGLCSVAGRIDKEPVASA